MFCQGCAIAAWNAVAANPAGLEMRRRDSQRVAFPFPRREPLPGVSCVIGRMLAAIHPDRSLRRLPGNVRVECDDLLRIFVDFFRDPEICRPSGRVVRRVRLALMLGQRQQGCIPTIAPEPRCIIDRQAKVIPDLRTRDALRLIFVESRRPFTGRIDLRKGRHTQEGDDKSGNQPEFHNSYS